MDEASLAALDAHRYLALVTFRRDGRAVSTPVWFAASGGRLYVFTAGDAGKVKRLRNDPRIRVAPCSARGAVRGDWIDGRARRLDEPEAIRRAYAALRRKYGWQMWLTDGVSRLSGRFRRRAILELAV
jgi:PPOX class probable F420-dependent enzyme